MTKNISSLRDSACGGEAISDIFSIGFLYWRLLRSLRSLAMTGWFLFSRNNGVFIVFKISHPFLRQGFEMTGKVGLEA